MKKTLLVILISTLAISACNKSPNTAEAIQKLPETTEFVKKIEAPKSDGSIAMLLPDFAALVAQEGGAVVNIQAVSDNAFSSNEPSTSDDPFSEFFKRFIPNSPEFSQEESEANFGSGFIISTDGYILTNAHVVKGRENIKIALNDKREFYAKLVGLDDKSDVALLKIDADHLPVAKIGNPNELKSGEWVAAIGAPFGFDNSVTAGIVSAKNRTLPNETYTPFIQTDVAINPGNSGGPLFNLRGQVVGINSQIYSRSGGFMGISFAIPIDVAMNVAEQLKATGKVQRGQLGVIIQEVSYDLSKSFGLDKPTGALVARVVPNSPAEKGGIQVGDIIRSVNNEEVRSSSDLPLTIGALAPGKEVKLGIWRKGKMLETIVVLGEQNNFENNHDRNEMQLLNSLGGFEFPAAQLNIELESNGDKRALVVRQALGLSARAGLKRGDILVEIAGKEVHTQEDFEDAIKAAGKNIPILVNRGGNMLFLALVLPE